MSVYSGCLKNIMTNILNTAKTTAEADWLGKDIWLVPISLSSKT